MLSKYGTDSISIYHRVRLSMVLGVSCSANNTCKKSMGLSWTHTGAEYREDSKERQVRLLLAGGQKQQEFSKGILGKQNNVYNSIEAGSSSRSF